MTHTHFIHKLGIHKQKENQYNVSCSNATGTKFHDTIVSKHRTEALRFHLKHQTWFNPPSHFEMTRFQMFRSHLDKLRKYPNNKPMGKWMQFSYIFHNPQHGKVVTPICPCLASTSCRKWKTWSRQWNSWGPASGVCGDVNKSNLCDFHVISMMLGDNFGSSINRLDFDFWLCGLSGLFETAISRLE